MLLTPLVLLWLGARFRQRARTREAADASDPRALPADLRTIRVPGQTYDVDLESGLVLDEKTWTETTSTVHTVPGQQQVIGNTIYTSGGYSYVTYGSTRKDRIFIRTPEGRDHPWICTDIGFETLKGHVVSRVAPAAGTPGENDFFLLYNHSTGQVVKLPGVIRRHVVRKRYLWLATAAVGVLGTVWAFQLDTPDSATGQLSGIMAFAALVLVALTAFVVRLLRNRTFNRRYYPQLCKLLVERSPTIIQRCGGGKNSSGL